MTGRVESGPLVFLRETSVLARLAISRLRSGTVAGAVRALLAHEESRAGGAAGEVLLHFDTPCAQACEFCEQPVLRTHAGARVVTRLLRVQHDRYLDLVSTGAFAALLDELGRRRPPVPLVITGHDWTRHPHRDALLAAIEARPETPVGLQGPSLAFDDRTLCNRVARWPNLVRVATTLQSSVAAEHDAIVGAPGAHARLVVALENLAAAGVRFELALVLTRRAVRSLPGTLDWIARRGYGVHLQAFIPDRALTGAADRLAPLDELRAALDATSEPGRGAVYAIVGVPPCALPPALRAKARLALATRERDPPAFGATCAGCSARAACSGVPAAYVRALGERGMRAIAHENAQA